MLLISALYGMDPLSIELSRDFWQVATASNHATLSDSVTISKRRPSARQVGYCVLYFIIKVLFGNFHSFSYISVISIVMQLIYLPPISFLINILVNY